MRVVYRPLHRHPQSFSLFRRGASSYWLAVQRVHPVSVCVPSVVPLRVCYRRWETPEREAGPPSERAAHYWRAGLAETRRQSTPQFTTSDRALLSLFAGVSEFRSDDNARRAFVDFQTGSTPFSEELIAILSRLVHTCLFLSCCIHLNSSALMTSLGLVRYSFYHSLHCVFFSSIVLFTIQWEVCTESECITKSVSSFRFSL